MSAVASGAATAGRPPVSGRRWLLGCAAGVFLVGLPILGGVAWWRVRGSEAQPRNLYAAVFEGAPAEVRKLSGGGVSFQGHDAWIRFETMSGEPRLRGRETFQPVDGAEPLAFFRNAFPDDRIDLDPANLDILGYTDRSKGYSKEPGSSGIAVPAWRFSGAGRNDDPRLNFSRRPT